MQRGSSILRRQSPGLCVALFVAAVLVRMPNFNESLWYDEAWYTFARLNETLLYETLFHDVHPPLYPLTMKGWIEVFGDSEIAVRLPSLLFGLASLGVVFRMARTWFGHRTALLATVLMAFSPVHIWYSQEAKNNVLLLLLTSLAVYGLQRAWRYGTRKDWMLFIVSTVLGLWTNYSSVWVLAAVFLWLWVRALVDRRHRSLKWIVGSTIVAALACLPLMRLTLGATSGPGMGYLRPFTPAELYKLLLVYLSHGNTLRTVSPYAAFHEILEQHWGFFLIDALFAFLLAAGIFLALGQRLTHRNNPAGTPNSGTPDVDLLLFYFAIPWIALLAASCVHPRVYIERSMILLLPPFFILVSCGVMSLSRRRLRCAVVSALFLLNGLSLVNLWVIKEDTWTVYKPNPDWRAFAEDLAEDPTRTVVFTSCPPLAMRYYLRDTGARAIPIAPRRHAGKREVRQHVSGALQQTGLHSPGFFYVAINRYWGASRGRELNDQVIQEDYPRVETRHYFGLDVYKYGFSK